MAETEDRLSNIESGLKGIQAALQALGPELAKHHGAMSSGNKTYLQAQDAIEELCRKERELVRDFGSVAKASEKERLALAALKKEAKEMTDRLGDARKASEQLSQKMKDLEEAAKAPTTAFGKIFKSTGDVLKGVAALGKGIMGVMDVGGKYAQMLGATAITMQGMVDRTSKYNQSMFTLSKTARIMGSGMGDMNRTFKFVQDNTTLSKNKFLELANAFNKTYLGAKPLPDEIAKFAKQIQESFGPDVETTMQVAQNLLNIQKQFPSLYQSITRNHEKMVEAQRTGNDKLLKEARAGSAADISIMMAFDYDPAQIEEIMQFQEGMTDAEKANMGLNQAMAKTTQKSEDALLAAGKAGEDAFKKIADYSGRAYDTMAKFPGAIFKATAAMEALSAATAAFGAMQPVVSGIVGSLSKSYSRGKEVAAGVSGVTGMKSGTEAAATSGLISTMKTSFQGLMGGMKAMTASIGTVAIALGAIEYALQGISLLSKNKEQRQQTYDGLAEEIDQSSTLGGIWIGMKNLPTVFGGIIDEWMSSRENEEKGKGLEADNRKREQVLQIRDKSVDPKLYKEFGKLMQQKKKAGKEEVAAAREAVAEIKAQEKALLANVNATEAQAKAERKKSEDARKAVLSYIAQNKEIEKSLALHTMVAEAIQGEIDVASKYNAVTQEQLDKQVAAQRARLEDVKGYIGLLPKLSSQVSDMAGKPIELGIGDTDAEKLADTVKKLNDLAFEARENLKGAQEAFDATPEADRQKGSAVDNALLEAKKKEQGMAGRLADAQQKQKINAAVTGDLTESISASYRQQGDQLQKMNRMEMERLQTETEIYSTANFGMGPSVEMLQKQVDLTYEMLRVSQEQLDLAKEKLKTEMNVDSAIADQIATAKTGAEAKAMIDAEAAKHTGKEKETGFALLKYYEDAKQLTNERMQSEKKIMELTKEMREGYLDALRESMTNAKEMGKIISTQNMGITSMMRSVKKVTGENKLNTMARGGVSERGSEAWKARMVQTGRYGLAGPEFAGSAMEKRTDINNWKQSQIAMERIRAGKSMGLESTRNRVGGGTLGEPTINTAGRAREMGITMSGRSAYPGAGRLQAGVPAAPAVAPAAATEAKKLSDQQEAALKQLQHSQEKEGDELINAVKALPKGIADEMALLSPMAAAGIIPAVKQGAAPGQEANTKEGIKQSMATGTAYLAAANTKVGDKAVSPKSDAEIAAREMKLMDADIAAKEKEKTKQYSSDTKEGRDAFRKHLDDVIARGEASARAEKEGAKKSGAADLDTQLAAWLESPEYKAGKTMPEGWAPAKDKAAMQQKYADAQKAAEAAAMKYDSKNEASIKLSQDTQAAADQAKKDLETAFPELVDTKAGKPAESPIAYPEPSETRVVQGKPQRASYTFGQGFLRKKGVGFGGGRGSASLGASQSRSAFNLGGTDFFQENQNRGLAKGGMRGFGGEGGRIQVQLVLSPDLKAQVTNDSQQLVSLQQSASLSSGS